MGAGFSVDAISKVISIVKNVVDFKHASSVARDTLRHFCEKLGEKVLEIVTACPNR